MPSTSVLTVKQLQRRQRVIDTALELLETRDYDRIQVKDVAERAGVALGTLYHYFSSKEHLFAEALIAWAGNLRGNLERHPLDGDTPAERLVGALYRATSAFERQPQLAKLVATLEGSDDRFAAEILARLDRITTAVYLDVLADVDPERAATVVLVCMSVFACGLQAWSSDRITIAEMRGQLGATVELVFDAVPKRLLSDAAGS